MIACVVGAGAREHALALSLARSIDVIATPGNAGIVGRTAEGHSITSTTAPPSEIEADLFVIGPEVPLVEGLADDLRANGRRVFGPGAAASRLEGSKAYMKLLAERAQVPTAHYSICRSMEEAKAAFARFGPPYVVKTDGLAAGKGVLVTADRAVAELDVARKLSGELFGDAGKTLVVEEGLLGDELSLLVVTDGKAALALPPARDYKRVLDGDGGANTGGMGAFSPVPDASELVVGEIMDRIVEPTLALLRKDGVRYQGVLYAGCMLTAEGPKLVEFNVRFGDPEAEAVLPRISSDFASLAASVASGKIAGQLRIDPRPATCVVLAAAGYPGPPHSGDVISGIAAAEAMPGAMVFHGGTTRALDGTLQTAGGRVLAVTALGESLEMSRSRAYAAVDAISFSGMHYRHDIAARAMVRSDIEVGAP